MNPYKDASVMGYLRAFLDKFYDDDRPRTLIFGINPGRFGAGITGVATARALAGYPGSVVVLEQFDVGHARGSSHGTSRIFRLNYADERFVRMAMASDVAWRRPP